MDRMSMFAINIQILILGTQLALMRMATCLRFLIMLYYWIWVCCYLPGNLYNKVISEVLCL